MRGQRDAGRGSRKVAVCSRLLGWQLKQEAVMENVSQVGSSRDDGDQPFIAKVSGSTDKYSSTP